MPDLCKNPFFKCKGDPSDVIVYLTDNKIPICRKCWLKIADGDFQWSP